MSENDTDRVGYDEIAFAFRHEEIERDGIIAEVEAVKTASDSPGDDDARYTFEVRARSVDTGTDHSDHNHKSETGEQ